MLTDSYVFPPRKAEIANSITHAIGIVFSLGTLLWLYFYTPTRPDGRLNLLIFAGCMLEMYSISTAYHWTKPITVKKTLRLFDHISIYFLIAGTYTPFIMLCLQGALKYMLLTTVWGIVVLGIIYKLTWWKRHPKVSLYIYLSMGWMILFFIKPLYEALPLNGFIWLIGGGLLYSAGTIFYANRTPMYNHAIWHLFVVGGSICHFMAILTL